MKETSFAFRFFIVTDAARSESGCSSHDGLAFSFTSQTHYVFTSL